MKKILVSLAAASVLVAGVATAVVITGSSASAQEAEEEGPATEKPERGSVIREVLTDGPVDLTEAEVDSIMEALEEKWEELKANRPDGYGRKGGPGYRRGFHGGTRFGYHIGQLLADGVIDATELADLPEGHVLTDPDGPFGAVNTDDEITQEEFDEVIAELRAAREARRGSGLGPRFGDDVPDVEGASI